MIEYKSLFMDETIFPCGNVTQHIVKVVGIKRGPDGNFIGRSNTNPTINSREYMVHYPYGTEETLK